MKTGWPGSIQNCARQREKKAGHQVHRDARVIRDKYQYFTQANLLRLHGTGYDTPVTSLENAVQDYVRKYLIRQRLDPSAP